MLVYDRDGRFLRAWGEGMFTRRTHGITIGPDDMVYCTDDGDHTVSKLTPTASWCTSSAPVASRRTPAYDGRNPGLRSSAPRGHSIGRRTWPFRHKTQLNELARQG